MLHDHDRTGPLWGGACTGCLVAVWPLIRGARVEAERELVEVRGWELVPPEQIRCTECSPRAREVKMHDRRGRRRR